MARKRTSKDAGLYPNVPKYPGGTHPDPKSRPSNWKNIPIVFDQEQAEYNWNKVEANFKSGWSYESDAFRAWLRVMSEEAVACITKPINNWTFGIFTDEYRLLVTKPAQLFPRVLIHVSHNKDNFDFKSGGFALYERKYVIMIVQGYILRDTLTTIPQDLKDLKKYAYAVNPVDLLPMKGLENYMQENPGDPNMKNKYDIAAYFLERGYSELESFDLREIAKEGTTVLICCDNKAEVMIAKERVLRKIKQELPNIGDIIIHENRILFKNNLARIRFVTADVDDVFACLALRPAKFYLPFFVQQTTA